VSRPCGIRTHDTLIKSLVTTMLGSGFTFVPVCGV